MPRRRGLKVKPENLKRRADGSWAYRMSFGTDPVTGKPEQHQCTISADTRDEALAKAQTWLDHWHQDPKLGVALRRFLDQLEREEYNARTLAAYRVDVARLTRAIGNIRVRDLTSHDVDNLWPELREHGSARGGKLSAVTVRHTRSFLSQAYTWFCVEGYAATNPVKLARPYRYRRKEVIMLEEDDVAELRDHLAKELGEGGGEDPVAHRHALAVYLGLYFGLRVGEVCGLQRRDVDLRRRQLHVRGKVVEVPTLHREDGTKTGSVRNLSMTDENAEVLGRYLAWQETRHPGIGRTQPLVGVPGELCRPSLLSHWFGTSAMGEYDLTKHYKFHALRHTHATMLMESRVEPQTVAERLGHSRVSTTVDNYAHVMPGRDQAAARAFGDAMGGL